MPVIPNCQREGSGSFITVTLLYFLTEKTMNSLNTLHFDLIFCPHLVINSGEVIPERLMLPGRPNYWAYHQTFRALAALNTMEDDLVLSMFFNTFSIMNL